MGDICMTIFRNMLSQSINHNKNVDI